MQPLYATWTEPDGRKVHTRGLGTRVDHLEGWINAAVGVLADILVVGSGPAAQQPRAWCKVMVPEGCSVKWDAEIRTLLIERQREG